MGRTFTEKIDAETLAKKIFDACMKAGEEDAFFDKEDLEQYPTFVETIYNNSYELSIDGCTKKVIYDLSKVDYDTENFECADGEGYVGYDCGFQTLSNGLTALFCTAGGYWEYPICFIIYWSGKELRGYIPTKGNRWNRSQQCAFGNDHESDKKEFLKFLSEEDKEEAKIWEEEEGEPYPMDGPPPPNTHEIIEDIEARIKYTGG